MMNIMIGQILNLDDLLCDFSEYDLDCVKSIATKVAAVFDSGMDSWKANFTASSLFDSSCSSI